MNKILALASIGAAIAILFSLFNIAVGIAYGDVLKSYGLFVSEGKYDFAQLHPDIAQFESIRIIAYGSVGLSAGIIGLIGVKIGKNKGGILLVVASAISLITFGFVGILPAILLLTSGVLALRQRPAPSFQKQ